MPNVKRLAQMQRSAKRLATLSQISENLTKLQKDMKGSVETIRLTKREGIVTHRLMALMKSGRLTPAEYKKMDIKKLANLSEEATDTVISSFEVREPVIDPAQRGSKTAEDFASIGKHMEKKKLKNLEKETVKDLMRASGGKIKLKAGSRLAEEGSEEDDDHGKGHEMSGPVEKHVSPGADEHAVPGEGGDVEMKAKFHANMAECGKHLDAGNIEEAKKCHAAAMAHLESHGDKHLSFGVGDTKSEDYKKGMDQMEEKVDELSTNLARLAGAVGELMEQEKEEGHDLAAEEPEDKKIEEEVEEDKH